MGGTGVGATTEELESDPSDIPGGRTQDCSPSREGSAGLQALGEELLWPQDQAVRQRERASEAGPGN